MDKILKSIIFTGFLIISSLLVTLSINGNKIFAIEYNTFTNETLGMDIEFQYPNDWVLDTTDFDIDILYINDPNVEKSISITEYNNEELGNVSDLRTFTEEEFNEELELNKTEEIEDFEIKKIENLTTISIGNLEMGTFTEEYKFENDTDTTTSQFWTILSGGKGYNIEFSAPTSTFNSPEVSEIRDQFIKSVKIVERKDK